MKPADKHMLQLLQSGGIPHQLVLAKVDKILFGRKKDPPAISDERLARLAARYAHVQKQAEETYREQKQEGKGAAATISNDIVGVSAEKPWPKGSGKRLGIEDLRWMVLQAVGLDSDEEGKRRTLVIDVLEEVDEGFGRGEVTRSEAIDGSRTRTKRIAIR